ncbi:MAG TPA: TIGR04255 family protein [bacterium]|nr:TIGR04255 family protein [bacterium]
MSIKLSNKPLVEAILELKWELEKIAKGVRRDPMYPFYVGKFHDLLKDDYSHIDRLAAAQLPDEITPHEVKYRFRKAKGAYPLIQAGPGVATLNFTDEYHWDAFLAAAKDFLRNLVEAYGLGGEEPKPRFSSILLRYINAVQVDPRDTDIIEYMSAKLHTKVALPDQVAASPQISGDPVGFYLSMSYPLNRPEGVGTIRLATGQSSGKPAVIWELNIQSQKEQSPREVDECELWLKNAHEVAESWFFNLIKGELENQFGGSEDA